MRLGSLFSGIGLMDYGLEQAGMETVWQVEFDDWRREVALPQNFPNAQRFKDVREVGKHNLPKVDVIAGGFPCQDLSLANTRGKGLDGERSGLWFEFARIIREVRPHYVIVENVAAFAIRGLDRVLCDLAESGYDAEWQTLSASAFGLPHQRKRLFIVAYTGGIRSSVWCGEVFRERDFERSKKRPTNPSSVPFDVFGRSYFAIPDHLRVGDGRTYELSEIENAVAGYGNGVAVPVAQFVGECVMRHRRRNV